MCACLCMHEHIHNSDVIEDIHKLSAAIICLCHYNFSIHVKSEINTISIIDE